MKRAIGEKIFLLVMALGLIIWATVPACADEARCAWFSRFEWGTRQDIVDEITNIKNCNMNAVLFQIRGEADAFYISQHEPWSEIIGGSYPGYDPLAVAIYEAHKRGLELHAYVNAFPVWSDSTPPIDPDHIYNAHPEWVMVTSSGVPMDPEGPYGYAFVSPGIPQVREHINQVIMDIVTNYDIDGVHLDYIRYPSTSYSYDDSSVARFLRENPSCSYPPGNCPGLWNNFRRNLVSEVVEATYDSVTALKPWVKFSAAVWGTFYDGYTYYYQDSHGWLEDGIMDFTAPMVYDDDTTDFRDRLHDHAVAKYGRHVYGGIGVYYAGMTPEIMVDEIDICHDEEVEGQALFSATDLYGAYKTALIGSGGPYQYAENMPAMAWKAAKPFAASVAIPPSSNHLDVLFDREVDLTTAQDEDNYTFDNGLECTAALRDASDHRLVHLLTNTHYQTTLYTLTVDNVAEEGSKSVVAWPNNQRKFYGKDTAPDYIVDNEDSLNFVYVGNWWLSSSGNRWGFNKRCNDKGVGTETATWIKAITTPGNYILYFWVNSADYTEDAHYIVHTVAGLDSAIGDQNYVSIIPGEEDWNYLGIFPFADTARIIVTDYFTTKNNVIADAIRLVYHSPLPPSVPPAAVVDLETHKSSGDIVLTWSAVTSDTLGNPKTVDGYVIYRHTDPTTVPDDSIGMAAGTEFTDPGAAGSIINNYFYIVRAVDDSKSKSAASNLVGEFDSQLINASKAILAKKTKSSR